jgi:hypothetical protein
MANMSVYLVYEGPTGIPVTIARLTDPAVVQQVAQLALGSAEDRAAAIAETDLVWGEMEKVEVIRLRMILNMLLGKPSTPASDRQPQHAPVGVM